MKRNVPSVKLLLERLGLHQCQGKYGQPVRPTGRIPFEGASVMVPPIAKHPCTYRHRWNSNLTQGPFVTRMVLHLGHFTVISIAENVTTLYSVLPVCQGGHSAQSIKSITILDRTSVTPVSNNSSPRNFHHTEKVWKRRFHDEAMLPMDLHTQKTFGHRAWLKKWLSVRCLFAFPGGHRRTTSSASDASGEAGSEQGWSVVGPPGKRASKNSSLEPWEETR